MSILMVMPNWGLASELWLWRMVDALEDKLSAIACRSPPHCLWHNKIPFVNLSPPGGGRRLLPWGAGRSPETGDAALRRAIRSPSVQCVLVHYAKFALQFREAWETTRKPVFVYCHGFDTTWDLRTCELRNVPMFDADYPQSIVRLSRRAKFIANSQYTRSQLLKIGVPEERIVLRYFGIPLPENPVREQRDEVSILYLGRLVDFKGPDLVIRAFELACDNGLAGRLVIAGDGPLGVCCKLLQGRSRYADRIRLLGTVDAETGHRLRREADIFTAHSCTGLVTRQTEAFGVAFGEAMAAALPVVTGRSGGIPELVEDGVSGILFEPGDVRAHAAALLELAANQDRRLAMGTAARRRIERCFPWQRERDSLIDILSPTRG